MYTGVRLLSDKLLTTFFFNLLKFFRRIKKLIVYTVFNKSTSNGRDFDAENDKNMIEKS